MKTGLLALGAVLLIANAIRLSVPAQRASTFRGVEIVPSKLNLGQVRQGDFCALHFNLHNSSDETINDIVVEASCGCTEIKANTTTLGPGETALVEGSFDSTRRRGHVEVALLLRYLTHLGNRDEVLPVSAEVIPEVSMSPEYVRFRVDDPQTERRDRQEVTLTSRTDESFGIERIVCSHPALDAQEMPLTAISDSKTKTFHRRLAITFDRSQWREPLNTVSKPLWVSVRTSVPTEPELQIRVIVEHEGVKDRESSGAAKTRGPADAIRARIG